MKILIIKTGAAGHVVRTTTLLNILDGEIDWVVNRQNAPLLNGLKGINKIILNSEKRKIKFPTYDLVINLEDSLHLAEFVSELKFKELIGVYTTKSGELKYTENTSEWFDLSLISKYGLEKANELKFENRKSFQEIIFKAFGKEFHGEKYLLPKFKSTNLSGDIAIAPKAGKVWPMKNWAYYLDLAQILRAEGFKVNFLPQRQTLTEHIGDISNHSLLISGDSLPMHLALGLNVEAIALFICTSPYEIYDYGILTKVVSPQLKEFFYRRDFVPEATRSIKLSTVLESVYEKLGVTVYGNTI